jgi:hypothetical protein
MSCRVLFCRIPDQRLDGARPLALKWSSEFIDQRRECSRVIVLFDEPEPYGIGAEFGLYCERVTSFAARWRNGQNCAQNFRDDNRKNPCTSGLSFYVILDCMRALLTISFAKTRASIAARFLISFSSACSLPIVSSLSLCF